MIWLVKWWDGSWSFPFQTEEKTHTHTRLGWNGKRLWIVRIFFFQHAPMLFFFVVVFFWAACTLGLTWTKFIHRYHSTSATASVACKAFKGCFFHLVSTCTASRCWIKHLFIYLFKKNINTFHNPQPTVTERGKPTEVSRGWNESCSSTRRTSGLNLRGIAIKDIFVKMLSWWRLLPLMRCLELIFPTRLSTTQTPTAPPAAVFTEHVQWERDSTVEEETDDFVRRTSFISCLILPISQSDPVCLTSNYQPTAFIHHSTTCSSSGIWKVSGGGGGKTQTVIEKEAVITPTIRNMR